MPQTKNKAAYIAVLSVIFAAFFVLPAKAMTIQQPFKDDTKTTNTSYGWTQFRIPTSTTYTTTTVDTLTKWGDDLINLSNFSWTLYSTSTGSLPDSWLNTYNVTSKMTYINGDANGVACGNPCIISIPEVTLDPNLYYILNTWDRFAVPSTQIDDVGYQTRAFLRDSKSWTCDSSANCDIIPNEGGWRFRLSLSDEGADSVGINSPTATTDQDFTFWDLNFYFNPPATTTNPFVGIFYTKNGVNYFDSDVLPTSTNRYESTYWIAKTHSLEENTTSSNVAHISAYGVLGGWDENGDQITFATSTPVYFNIITIRTATSSLYGKQCEDSSGYFMIGLCKLFIPSTGAQIRLSNLGTELRLKPPWGYVVAATDAINTIQATSTSANMVTSIVSTFSTFFGAIKTALTAFLWLIFAWWIVNRIKHVHT